METINNSQEQNEALDRLHPEYGQYVIVNVERGPYFQPKFFLPSKK